MFRNEEKKIRAMAERAATAICNVRGPGLVRQDPNVFKCSFAFDAEGVPPLELVALEIPWDEFGLITHEDLAKRIFTLCYQTERNLH